MLLTAQSSAPFEDGQSLGSGVLETWQLNAELVTLSACESGIGRSGGGDGLLGFSQAFLRRREHVQFVSVFGRLMMQRQRY